MVEDYPKIESLEGLYILPFNLIRVKDDEKSIDLFGSGLLGLWGFRKKIKK